MSVAVDEPIVPEVAPVVTEVVEVVEPELDADGNPVEPVVVDDSGNKPGLTHDEALAEVEKVRKEAANYRRRLREAESLLTAAKNPDEVEAIISGLRDERETSERTLLIENASLKHSLPPALAARIQGNTREEIEADAKALSEFVVASGDIGDPKGGLDPFGDKDTTPDDPAALARLVNRGRKSASA